MSLRKLNDHLMSTKDPLFKHVNVFLVGGSEQLPLNVYEIFSLIEVLDGTENGRPIVIFFYTSLSIRYDNGQ